MSVSEILERLEAAGTEQNRKVYRRRGVNGPMYGVSFAARRQSATAGRRRTRGRPSRAARARGAH